MVVVETNITTKVRITKTVCDVPEYYAGGENSSGRALAELSAAAAIEEWAGRLFTMGQGERTPYPYQMRVPRKHVHKVKYMARQGKGSHGELKTKGQNTSS